MCINAIKLNQTGSLESGPGGICTELSIDSGRTCIACRDLGSMKQFPKLLEPSCGDSIKQLPNLLKPSSVPSIVAEESKDCSEDFINLALDTRLVVSSIIV